MAWTIHGTDKPWTGIRPGLDSVHKIFHGRLVKVAFWNYSPAIQSLEQVKRPSRARCLASSNGKGADIYTKGICRYEDLLALSNAREGQDCK